MRVREELEDPDPFCRGDADVVGVAFLMRPGVAGANRYEGVEFVGELDDLVEHGFAELRVVGMVEPLLTLAVTPAISTFWNTIYFYTASATARNFSYDCTVSAAASRRHGDVPFWICLQEKAHVTGEI